MKRVKITLLKGYWLRATQREASPVVKDDMRSRYPFRDEERVRAVLIATLTY